jgi:hypothetical protein
MPDISDKISSQIRTSHTPAIKWNDEFIFPRYDGFSSLNLPGTTASLLGSSGVNSTLLSSEITGQLKDRWKNIVFILLDALSFHRFKSWINEDPNLVWNRMIPEGVLAPITAICPSTTCAAITTLWTGASAAEHGVLGYEMWLKEYGVTANMIEHKPITYQKPGGHLSLAGFDPHSFLSVPPITEQMLKDGIEVHAFQHFAIINSGLSRMFMEKAERHPISTATDMWISIRELLESRPDAKKFIWAYWDKVDSISHFHGPDSERAKAEFLSFSKAFESSFMEKLDPKHREDTLLILTADHGQITTDRNDPQYQLINHPQFIEMLHMNPSGENRLAYLHIKPGQTQSVLDYIHHHWPKKFMTMEPQEAVEGGLFGPGKPHPEIYNRLGDLIVAARENAYWWWAAKENPLIGRHGGLSKDEMLVPFLAAKL